MSRFADAALSFRRRRTLVRVGAAVVLVALGLAGGLALRVDAPDTAVAERRDLTLSVDVEGELIALRSTAIGPPLVRDLWEYRITFLAPEGSQVARGEPVVGFDTSPLQRMLEQKRAEYEEAAKKIERKELEVRAQQRDLELERAEAESRLAKARLKNDVPEELRPRVEVRKTGLELRNAEQALANLTARIAAVRESEAAALNALIGQRDGARRRVAEIEESIRAMTVRAPQDGVVIYNSGWRDEKKKVGDSVWHGETIVTLPDLGEMLAEGLVDEADAGAVAVGQRVVLRLEAVPGRDWTGRIAQIARAVRRRSWRVPTKVFRVKVALDEAAATLRPAMRFRGSIETGRVEAALVVPREAVQLRNGVPTVRVPRWIGATDVPVSIGRHNRRFVEITRGVTAGERVVVVEVAWGG